MSGTAEVAGDITAASTALSGLLLVFLGATATSFDSFGAVDQGAVKAKYRRRAGIALAGFFASLFAAILSIAGKWRDCPLAVDTSAGFLGLSLLLVGIAAWMTFSDIC